MWIVPCEGLISVSWSGHMLTQCYSLLFTLARVYWPECAPVWRDGGHQVFKEISHRLIKRVFFFFLSLLPTFSPPSPVPPGYEWWPHLPRWSLWGAATMAAPAPAQRAARRWVKSQSGTNSRPKQLLPFTAQHMNTPALFPQVFLRRRHQFNAPFANRGRHIFTFFFCLFLTVIFI